MFKALLLFCAVLFCTNLSAQDVNQTKQLPNRGFEDYDNLWKDDEEPVGWNSFMGAKTSGATGMGKAKRLERSDEKRPGTTGSYSVKLFANQVLGVNANGNITTGRINMGSTTPSDEANHNFTDRASAGFNFPFNTVPDSMVVWVKYSPRDNGSDQGQIRAIIHNDNNTTDPFTNMNEAVAVALINPGQTNGNWVRYSAPFSRSGCGSRDPRYILVSATTNKVPGGGRADIWIDDILFVYNPKITPGELPMHSLNMRDGAVSFDVPFTVQGTLSLNANSAVKTRVVAELSDAEGNFPFPPVTIGSMETETSGNLTVTIPAGTPLGDHYRIRLHGTDRKVYSEKNNRDLVLMRGFTITASCNNQQGKTDGGGAYKEGSVAILTATPYTGYHFSHWEENGQRVENAPATYTFDVNVDRRLTAVFAINEYELKVEVESKGKVNISPEKTRYLHNERVNLEAVPDAGYGFEGYFNDKAIRLSTNEQYSFNITANTTITARFKQDKLQITATSEQPTLGRVKGGGSYEPGHEVTLSAIPEPFCYFVAWVEGTDTVSRAQEYQFIVEKARTLRAIFAQQYYNVTVQANMQGAGILTGAGRYSAASSSTTIILEATANKGYEFLYWESDKDGSIIEDNPLVVMENNRLTEDLSFTAHFATKKYNVSLMTEPEGVGRLSGAGSYDFREWVTIEAYPNEGYDFVAWIRLDNASTDTVYENPYKFAIREGLDREYKAVFHQHSHTVRLMVEPENYGRVSGGGEYLHFDTATLLAEAKEGYEFLYWGVKKGLGVEKITEQNPCKIKVVSNIDRVAVFSKRRKNIASAVKPEKSGVVSGAGQYAEDSYAVLKAEAAHGYRFKQWEDAAGNKASFDPQLQLLVKNDTTVYARFEPLRYTFVLMSEGTTEAGNVRIDAGEYGAYHKVQLDYNQTVNISAKPNLESYRFTQWRRVYTQDGRLCDSMYSRNINTTYTVDGESRIVACFAQNTHEIAAAVSPLTSCGEVKFQGSYRHEYWAELHAVPAPGYKFVRWTDTTGTSLGITSPRLRLQALGDTAVKAVFAPDTVQVQLRQSGKGVLSGAGRYAYGKTVTLTAVPAYGYRFDGWYAASDTAQTTALTKESLLSFVAAKREDIRAVFAPANFALSVTPQPLAGGRVSGGGNYRYQAEAVLQALPNKGYALRYFCVEKRNGKYDTLRQDRLGFRMDTSRNVVAVFAPESYAVQAFASNSTQGGVSVSQAKAAYADRITLKATASQNHKFMQWRDAYGKRVARTAEISVGVYRDTTLYADFEPVDKSLRAEAEDARQGYVKVHNNRPPYGSSVLLEAVPNDGYVFDAWVSAKTPDQVLSHSSAFSVLMLQDTALVAKFKPTFCQIRLAANIPQAGRVRIDDVSSLTDTIDNGQYMYVARLTKLLLSASANEHYTFSEWVAHDTLRRKVSSLGESPVLAYEVEEDMAIEAVFTPKDYRVEVKAEPAEWGSVDGSAMYAYGEAVTVRAEEGGADYVFKGWRSADGWLSASKEYTFTMGQDTLLVACFDRDSIFVEVQAGLGGMASGGGIYARNASVELNAKAAGGYAFDAWYNAAGEFLSNENPYVIKVARARTITAKFVPMQLQVNVEATEGGEVYGGGKVTYGSSVSLEAVPDEGYRFVRWESENIDSLSATLPLLGMQASENISLKAIFEAVKHRIDTRVSPVGSGSVTPGDLFDHGSEVSFQAKPDDSHVFMAWTLNGKEVSTDAFLKHKVQDDAVYVAVFAPKRYRVVTSVYPEQGGLAYGGGLYYLGDTAKIGIYLYDSVTFKNWSDADFNTVSTNTEFWRIITHTEIFTASVDMPVKKQDTVINTHRIVVYPNPLTDNDDLHILSDESNITALRLFNMSGRYVFYRKLSEKGEKEASVRLPKLQAGCYFYEIKLLDGSRRVGKLIKL